jgi:hypothetical protein
MATHPQSDKRPKGGDKPDKKVLERELEEGLEESFPASDPPAVTDPGSGTPRKR